MHVALITVADCTPPLALLLGALLLSTRLLCTLLKPASVATANRRILVTGVRIHHSADLSRPNPGITYAVNGIGQKESG